MRLRNGVRKASPTRKQSENKMKVVKRTRVDTPKRKEGRKPRMGETPKMKGREVEHGQVYDFLSKCYREEHGGSLYVSGVPGTGKSLSMSVIAAGLPAWEQAQGFEPAQVTTVNLMTLSNPGKTVFTHLRDALCSSASSLNAETDLRKTIFSRRSALKVVILDEIDAMVSGTALPRALITLFNWADAKNSKLILIGIANAIDLADRLVDSLVHRPSTLVFRPYSKAQLRSLITDRITGTTDFDDGAIELCARKVAGVAGDMRQAMELVRTSTARAEGGVVGMRDVAATARSLFASKHIEVIQSLPQQQQIALCVAALLFQKRDRAQVTPNEFQSFYYRTTRTHGLPDVLSCQFMEIANALVTHGLLAKSGSASKTKLRINVDFQDIEFAFQDDDFFLNILNLGEQCSNID